VGRGSATAEPLHGRRGVIPALPPTAHQTLPSSPPTALPIIALPAALLPVLVGYNQTAKHCATLGLTGEASVEVGGGGGCLDDRALCMMLACWSKCGAAAGLCSKAFDPSIHHVSNSPPLPLPLNTCAAVAPAAQVGCPPHRRPAGRSARQGQCNPPPTPACCWCCRCLPACFPCLPLPALLAPPPTLCCPCCCHVTL
jgi:hypothetical protein